MRWIAALVFGTASCTVQGQPIGFSQLLALTTCTDTTCMEAFADSAGFCKMPGVGNEEDGWIWFSCAHIGGDGFTDPVHLLSLGYFGYAHSNYREYILGTRDTVLAETLTQELNSLHFTPSGTVTYGQRYHSATYPDLHVLRLEKRGTNIGRDGTAREELMWVFKVVVPKR